MRTGTTSIPYGEQGRVLIGRYRRSMTAEPLGLEQMLFKNGTERHGQDANLVVPRVALTVFCTKLTSCAEPRCCTVHSAWLRNRKTTSKLEMESPCSTPVSIASNISTAYNIPAKESKPPHAKTLFLSDGRIWGEHSATESRRTKSLGFVGINFLGFDQIYSLCLIGRSVRREIKQGSKSVLEPGKRR